MNTCAAPSSAICSSARPRCLAFIGSSGRTRRRNSGAKLGMPVKCSASPSVSASPMRSVPWFGMPMMSPAHASSASSRSLAWNSIALCTPSALPVRGTVSFMPRVKWPDASRTNAMRSRCFGSMFAWILNTKPDDLRLGRRDRRARAPAAGAAAARASATPGEQLAHAEVVDRAAEEHRRQVALAIRLEVELRAQLAHHRDVLAQLRDRALGQQLVELRVVEARAS